MNLTDVKSKHGSRVYHRHTLDGLTLTTHKSSQYSRKFAQTIFQSHAGIKIVEYVTTGRKTDSQFIGIRGCQTPPVGVYVYIASTGGKWGKSSKSYYR